MTTLEILHGMRELLADESRWTRRALSRDAAGQPEPVCGEKAACWCVWGAAIRVCRGDVIKACRVLAPLQKAAGCIALDDWNDDPATTFVEITDALDRAIALARGAA